ALVGVLLVALGFATWRAPLPWHRLLEAAATGITVAVIEEWTFRGIIFGLVRRSQPWPKALVIVSLVFAVLHFVRAPLVAPQVEEIHWWSGLALVPAHFWQFGEPVLLIGSLPTYFLVGATLAYTVVQTKSLAFAIGLHAGWVFALRGFGFLSRRVGEPTVWLGRDLISGIIPALLVALTWFLLVLMFRRRRI
ncbi:MAG TPA: CPBP family intramembrane glutamic endopeptidase, partial [Myxococcota bacterium]|nr:CPBP family intramembrane glutamic endopeptidase [Myxococcota bacterium]